MFLLQTNRSNTINLHFGEQIAKEHDSLDFRTTLTKYFTARFAENVHNNNVSLT